MNTPTDLELTSFVQRTYGWMCVGLCVTAIIAFIVAATPTLVDFFIENIWVFYGLLILELVAVFYFAIAAQKIGTALAGSIFLIYAALNGLTFSLIFLIFTASSIGVAFLVTAGTFGIMSLYGYFTKRDLTTVGNIAVMALFGLIIASVVNLFLSNSLLYWIITYAGILIFVALTAYDTQKLKKLYVVGESTIGGERKEAIVGALTLYLDFVNLFLLLLRLFGRQR
jgi:FtsH-binding integral membrane protein